jgi:hypothetical protein
MSPMGVLTQQHHTTYSRLPGERHVAALQQCITVQALHYHDTVIG